MTDTKNLKELAEKLAPAYQQPWESHRHSASAVTVGAVGEDGEYSDFIDVRISDYSAFDEHDDELGQWIAAANPQAILGLIADLEEARNGMEYQPIMRLKNELDRLKAENDALRKFSAEAYQVLGALDAPENVLDNASDAANGVPLRHETLLPFFAEDYEALRKDAARYRWVIASAWYVGPEPKGDTEAVSWHDHNDTMHGVTTAIDAAIEGAKQ
ncbi:ead/Ea22-like family protein [Pseudomonas aeruginosa]|uniref:ead/Ea22-like family protein n=1 Tax=Pseudomonas aeruginosa TaxID=287 RepID=UPI003D9C535F